LATKLNTDKVADAITPLVTKVANDPELREHAKAVLDSARTVYMRVQADPRGAVSDKRVHDEVVRASGSIRESARRLSEPPKKRRGRTMFKLVLGAALAAGAVISIRRALGSDEDEFEYQP